VPAVQPRSGDAGTQRRSAVISIGDGRAAALIRHLFESSGADILATDAGETPLVWVLDPVDSNIEAARRWRRCRPEGTLILFGRPRDTSMNAWMSLNPVTIENPDDFEAVRTAVRHALSSF